jgi:hypothetical protein
MRTRVRIWIRENLRERGLRPMNVVIAELVRDWLDMIGTQTWLCAMGLHRRWHYGAPDGVDGMTVMRVRHYGKRCVREGCHA